MTSVDSDNNDCWLGRLTGRIWTGHAVKMMMRCEVALNQNLKCEVIWANE